MTIVRPTVEFDHHSREFAQNREGILGELRRSSPVAYTESHGGYWVVSSFELVKRVLGDPETFSSLKQEDGSGGVTIPSIGPRLLPAEVDPPHHTELRKVLNPLFGKAAVDQLTPVVGEIVTTLVESIWEKQEFDVVHDVADVLPASVMVTYLGFPEEDRVPFIRSIQAAVSMAALEDGEESGIEAFASMCSEILRLCEERRQAPTGDLTSQLVHHTDPTLDEEELLWLIFTLLVGGIENTAALISNSMIFLAEDPTLRKELLQDPSLIPATVEELLRFVTPGVSLCRNVTVDVELGGVQLKAGDRVLVSLPGANHDGAMFPQGDAFDVRRSSRQHLAFGYGPHFCVGALLARVQFRILLEKLLAKLPNYVVHLGRAVRFEDAGIMNGWRTIPATAEPGRGRGQ